MLLNLDAGEHDHEPEELWTLADILAVACGGHAGDAASMSRLAAFVARSSRRTALGAHPSYPDRANFGRTSIAIEPAVLEAEIAAQCRALANVARSYGVSVHYVKPHGALYHDAARNRVIANAVIDGALVGTAIDDGGASPVADALAAARNAQIAFVGPPTGAFADAVRIRGLAYLREGFADRAVKSDGSLVPRSEPNALITDPAAAVARARELAGHVDTICVHGDSPGALDIARAVRTLLARSV
ncbi:MAG TPA: 5-oxoprolinase subunit PxpA [Kofleriaceae bacterium]|nr:5-oxoprolinase subunit PxpA [Kofleriaceae bacterium]